MRHGCAIHLDEQVVRQVAPRIHAEQLVEQVGGAGLLEPLLQQHGRIVGADTGTELLRIERGFFLGREVANPTEIGPAEWSQHPFQPAAQAAQWRHPGQTRTAQPLAHLTAQVAGGPSVHRLEPIAWIAGQQLIAAVAIEHHGDKLPAELRHIVGRDRGRIRVRLVIDAYERRQDLQRGGFDDELMMIRPEQPGDAPRMLQLVVPLLLESNGERFHGLGRQAAHHRHDGARIHTAAQKRAHGYVADEPQPHGLRQACLKFLPVLIVASRRSLRLIAQGPVRAFGNLSVFIDDDVPGR